MLLMISVGSLKAIQVHVLYILEFFNFRSEQMTQVWQLMSSPRSQELGKIGYGTNYRYVIPELPV